jgi:hypothetical protein
MESSLVLEDITIVNALRILLFPHWFSHSVRYHIRKKITFIGDTEQVKLNVTAVNFPTIGSLLKLQTSLTDLTGIRCTDDEVKTRPTKFWKYVCSLTKHNPYYPALYQWVLLSRTWRSSRSSCKELRIRL